MKNFIKEMIWLHIGLIIVSAGTYFFLVPNNLAVGGVSGLAMVIQSYFPSLSIGFLMFVMNTILFIVGLIFIGFSFGARSIYTSFAFSGLVWIFEKLIPMKSPLTNDIFIELLFGSLLSAIGIAIVFEQNASTGGTDIIAKIMNKYLHMDLGKALLLVDLIITLFACSAFGIKKGMYALLGVIILGVLIDVVIGGLNDYKKVEIVSSRGDLIKKYIIENLDRGATLYIGKGAYTNEEKEIINTVLDKKQFIKLKKYIHEIDKKAFIVTYNVHETLGEGFKRLTE
ncbi:YitT family protein [Haloimpatiens sp. FM7315]|uniref:YitT family protein n=1 Tax=Haloimpatiens sp. FM7315 TaxID=3298609 RepID=UPI0035A32F8F